MKKKVLNYTTLDMDNPKEAFIFLDKEIREIYRHWRKHLNKLDKLTAFHLAKRVHLLTHFQIFHIWKKVKPKNRKELSLYLCAYFKKYVALTGFRSTEIDIENFDIISFLPFRLERISRGEDPYRPMPQVYTRLRNSIIDYPFADMLGKLHQAEQILITGLNEKDTDEILNFLFAYGPALLCFFIHNGGKNLFNGKLSFSSGIIESLECYLDHHQQTKKSINDDLHLCFKRFVENGKKQISLL